MNSQLRIIPLQAQAHHMWDRREDEHGGGDRVLCSTMMGTGTSKQAHTYLWLSVWAKVSATEEFSWHHQSDMTHTYTQPIVRR